MQSPRVLNRVPGLSLCRAGLYKQLATLKGLVEEYREQPQVNQTLRGPIVQNLAQTGLDQDCPFRAAPASHDNSRSCLSGSSDSSEEPQLLSAESAEAVSEDDFSEYVGKVYQYLQVRKPTSALSFVARQITCSKCACDFVAQRSSTVCSPSFIGGLCMQQKVL